MEANNAKTTSQGILAHDKATVKLTTSTSGVSLVRRHSVALILFGGGGGMIDLQNDPFQKIISWYFLKILIPEWTFLMNQMICFSSWFLLRKHKKIISKGFKGLLQLKMNSLILPSSKLTNIPYQSSCTFEVRRFSMISKTLGYVIVSGRVWQSLITKSCLLRTYLRSALHHVKNLKLPPGWLLRVGYNPIKV